MKHYNLRITGKVQGVWFRASTRDKAREVGVNGFVRNEPDGSVYAELEGEESDVQELIDWCHKGPERARVEEVEVEEGSSKGFDDFEVRR